MKQNKDGKKIQNWHKPMHQWAFKNRFLRRRHVEPELQLPKETTLPSGQLNPMLSQEVDACWNYRDPHGFGWEDENAFEGNYSHFLWTIFNDANRPPNNPFGPLLANLEPTLPTDGGLDDGSIQHSDIPLVDRLRSFLDVIQGLPKQFEAFRDSIQDRMKDAESYETLRSAANDREMMYELYCDHYVHDLHHRLWLFSPFWIRTPKTWNGEGGWEGLIRHLFVQYEPPKFLYGEWYDHNFPRFKWIVWFNLRFSIGPCTSTPNRNEQSESPFLGRDVRFDRFMKLAKNLFDP